MTNCQRCGKETGPAFGLCSDCIQKEDLTMIDNFSALGTDPTCDVCGKYIQVGDRVMQTFIGPVKVLPTYSPEEVGELVVEEQHYRLVHENCEPVN